MELVTHTRGNNYGIGPKEGAGVVVLADVSPLLKLTCKSLSNPCFLFR